jgi:hypothetical protein
MKRKCLTCDSSAVLRQEAAEGLTVLAVLRNNAVTSAQRTQERGSPNTLLDWLAALVPAYPEAQSRGEDVV